MSKPKKKIVSTTTRKEQIQIAHPTRKELKQATKHALHQYRDVVKKLARR